LRIAHVQQRRDWDCGIACVEMLLRAASAAACGDACDASRSALEGSRLWEELTEGVQLGSVWTVDLALRLAERGMPVAYHTTMAGVNPGHASLSFYSDFDADAARLPALFERARALGVAVTEVRHERVGGVYCCGVQHASGMRTHPTP
jgi:hypothetical protein